MEMSIHVTADSGTVTTTVVLNNSKIALHFGGATVFVPVNDVPDLISELQKAFFVAVRGAEVPPQAQYVPYSPSEINEYDDLPF
jgi:hypothetical protein